MRLNKYCFYAVYEYSFIIVKCEIIIECPLFVKLCT